MQPCEERSEIADVIKYQLEKLRVSSVTYDTAVLSTVTDRYCVHL